MGRHGAVLTNSCGTCGAVWESRPSAARPYCSRGCAAVGQRVAVRLGMCRTCGAAFNANRNRTTYCSGACQRGSLVGRRRPPRIGASCPVPWAQCAVCEAWFVRRDARKACGPACAAEANRRISRAISARTKIVRERSCPECGDVFTPVYGDKRTVFCSPRCSRKLDRRARRRALRGRPRERVGLAEIAARDGWRCQICRHRVDRALSGAHPRGATLDHIVPVSSGGRHERRNLQLAHRACNSAKGVGRGQLRLDLPPTPHRIARDASPSGTVPQPPFRLYNHLNRYGSDG